MYYTPQPITITPARFEKLVKLMNETEFKGENQQKLVKDFSDAQRLLEDDVISLARINDSIIREAERFRRRRDPFSELSGEAADDETLDRLRNAVPGSNFIAVIYDVVNAVILGYRMLRDTMKDLQPEEIQPIELESSRGRGRKLGIPTTLEEIQLFQYQVATHKPTIDRFISAIYTAEKGPQYIIDLGRGIASHLDVYYRRLLQRHSTEGVEVHGDPISTDLAIAIFDNVDSSGEIQDGRDPDEVSAYSVSKGVLFAKTIRAGLIGEFVQNPDEFIKFFELHLRNLWTLAGLMANEAEPVGDQIRALMGTEYTKPRKFDTFLFTSAVDSIKELDPRNITYREKTGLMTMEERKALKWRNTTLGMIVNMFQYDTPEGIVQAILRRKAERRKYEMEENSFYVCKIGSGNQFLGEAPGALTILPGSKPAVSLDEIIGSGFGEVRDFLANVEHGAKWHDLFLATSPSKKVDKNNVLLVGPQGSGKTEILRGVASDRGSIGIFAQASDFLTCWKGEAEKNPKRLFEGGLKLQRESGRTVYFLIDEIDTILNGDQGHSAFGGTNLATEFQVLMDGITTYPNLALWGATNHPERIPMPLIRRFAKVIIVGELSEEDRIALLKQFMAVLPLAPEFSNGAWKEAAQLLDGAVGDVVRKIVDHVWRAKMGAFVHKHPNDAEKLVNFLNEDGKFEVGHFSAERRERLKEQLRPFVKVTRSDMMASIDVHLSNLAIRQEIETAKATYERARQFLAGLNEAR